MLCRSLRFVSHLVLAASTVGLGSASLFGQDAAQKPASAAPSAPPISRYDIFVGYSYLAPHGTIQNQGSGGTTVYNTDGAVDYGAIASATYWFNKYVGGQFEHGNHLEGKNDGFTTYSLGIAFRYPTDQGITPFVHGLAGAVRGGGPNNYTPGSATYHAYTWGPALTVGGGLDYALPFFNNHLALRLFQADYQYYHIDFGPQALTTGGRANLNNAQLSTGLVIKFGSIVPPPPVAYTCAVNPPSVFPGDPVTITGTATNLNPKKTAEYTWSGTGVKVSGTSNTAQVDTHDLQPGSYAVTGHVTEGKKPGQFADCTASITVKQFEPPTVSCTASPTTVNPGDSSTVTAQGVSPQNRPLTYSYSASAGQISGTGSSATLSTTGAPAGAVTVTCNVQDDKGQTASATTTVSINAPPPPPAPKTQAQCSISFDRDKRRPARVDNEAKACLDQFVLSLKNQSNASAVVVGEATQDEMNPPKHRGRHAKAPANLAAQRAVNAKDYLVTEGGIETSRISVRTGTQGNKEVENYLVPSGANFDSDVSGTTAVDESTVKAQPRKPLATRTHHHHRKATKVGSHSTNPQSQ